MSLTSRKDKQSPPAENRQPDSPDDLTKPSWKYVARKTAREFSKDQCTDLAAALTYYSVLALFPAMVAVLSLVGLVGQGQQTAKTVISVLSQVGISSKTLDTTILQLSNASGTGLAFVIGLATAL